MVAQLLVAIGLPASIQDLVEPHLELSATKPCVVHALPPAKLPVCEAFLSRRDEPGGPTSSPCPVDIPTPHQYPRNLVPARETAKRPVGIPRVPLPAPGVAPPRDAVPIHRPAGDRATVPPAVCCVVCASAEPTGCGTGCRQSPTTTVKSPASNPSVTGCARRAQKSPGPYLPHPGAGQAYGNTAQTPGPDRGLPAPASRFDRPPDIAGLGLALRQPTMDPYSVWRKGGSENNTPQSSLWFQGFAKSKPQRAVHAARNRSRTR